MRFYPLPLAYGLYAREKAENCGPPLTGQTNSVCCVQGTSPKKYIHITYTTYTPCNTFILQGVVTSIPPVDTLATGIKNFDRRNFALIA